MLVLTTIDGDAVPSLLCGWVVAAGGVVGGFLVEDGYGVVYVF